MTLSLPLHPSPGPSRPWGRSRGSTALSSLGFLPGVPLPSRKASWRPQGHNIKREAVVWGRAARGLRGRVMVPNFATNELCDLSKRLDLLHLRSSSAKESNGIIQFLRFFPAVEITISRISTVCKTAIFKSGPHLQQFLPYGTSAIWITWGKKHPSTNWSLLSLLKHFVVLCGWAIKGNSRSEAPELQHVLRDHTGEG